MLDAQRSEVDQEMRSRRNLLAVAGLAGLERSRSGNALSPELDRRVEEQVARAK